MEDKKRGEKRKKREKPKYNFDSITDSTMVTLTLNKLLQTENNSGSSYSKEKRKKDSLHPYTKMPGKGHNRDVCDACTEGGILLCCDLCISSFHMECCQPPLSDEKQIPEGSWVCHKCRVKSRNEQPSTSSQATEAESAQSLKRDRRAADRAGRRTTPAFKPTAKKRPSDQPIPKAAKRLAGKAAVEANEDEDLIQPVFDSLKTSAEEKNPICFNIPYQYKSLSYLPGDDKIPARAKIAARRNSAPKKKFSQQMRDGQASRCGKLLLCFNCSKICRKGKDLMIACDFCSAVFHLDCLDPPLTCPPTASWQCPLHTGNMIDDAILRGGITERVALYDTYDRQHVDQHVIKLDFLRKSKKRLHKQFKSINLPPRNTVQVPDFIKEAYKNPQRKRISELEMRRAVALFQREQMVAEYMDKQISRTANPPPPDQEATFEERLSLLDSTLGVCINFAEEIVRLKDEEAKVSIAEVMSDVEEEYKSSDDSNRQVNDQSSEDETNDDGYYHNQTCKVTVENTVCEGTSSSFSIKDEDFKKMPDEIRRMLFPYDEKAKDPEVETVTVQEPVPQQPTTIRLTEMKRDKLAILYQHVLEEYKMLVENSNGSTNEETNDANSATKNDSGNDEKNEADNGQRDDEIIQTENDTENGQTNDATTETENGTENNEQHNGQENDNVKDAHSSVPNTDDDKPALDISSSSEEAANETLNKSSQGETTESSNETEAEMAKEQALQDVLKKELEFTFKLPEAAAISFAYLEQILNSMPEGSVKLLAMGHVHMLKKEMDAKRDKSLPKDVPDKIKLDDTGSDKENEEEPTVGSLIPSDEEQDSTTNGQVTILGLQPPHVYPENVKAVIIPLIFDMHNNFVFFALKTNGVSLGKGSLCDMDIAKYGFCENVADFHATIVQDKVTKRFYMSNLSSHGIVVDSVLYSLGASDRNEREPTRLQSELHEIRTIHQRRVAALAPPEDKTANQMNQEVEAQPEVAKLCRCTSTVRKGLTGTAPLLNGSMFDIGCLEFVFSTVVNKRVHLPKSKWEEMRAKASRNPMRLSRRKNSTLNNIPSSSKG